MLPEATTIFVVEMLTVSDGAEMDSNTALAPTKCLEMTSEGFVTNSDTLRDNADTLETELEGVEMDS